MSEPSQTKQCDRWWVQPLSSTLGLNSCHLLCGRYCKLTQYPLPHLLINLLVLGGHTVENISQTPLHITCPPSAHTCSGLTGRSEQCLVAAKCRSGVLANEVAKTFCSSGTVGGRVFWCPVPTVISLLFLSALFLFVASEPNCLALPGMIWISSDCLLKALTCILLPANKNLQFTSFIITYFLYCSTCNVPFFLSIVWAP